MKQKITITESELRRIIEGAINELSSHETWQPDEDDYQGLDDYYYGAICKFSASIRTDDIKKTQEDMRDLYEYLHSNSGGRAYGLDGGCIECEQSYVSVCVTDVIISGMTNMDEASVELEIRAAIDAPDMPERDIMGEAKSIVQDWLYDLFRQWCQVDLTDVKIMRDDRTYY